MSSRLSNHVRSNVVGYVALFVALSGTVYAADKVGSNNIKTGAVKSKQVGDDKLKSRDLKDGKAVKSRDVKDGSLSEADIASESLTGESIGRLTEADIASGSLTGQSILDESLTAADIAPSAVRSDEVADEALRLRDLGGGLEGTTTVGTDLSIPAFECRWVQRLFNPPPPELIGSLVIGNITEADGSAAVANPGVVMPTMVTETSQNGAFVNIAICNARSGTLSVDEAAVVHWRTIPE